MGLDYSEDTRAMLARWAAHNPNPKLIQTPYQNPNPNPNPNPKAAYTRINYSTTEGSTFDWVIHNGDISYADNHISEAGKQGVAPYGAHVLGQRATETPTLLVFTMLQGWVDAWTCV
jgi:hypothetical protein